ncbi:RCC1 domain-containing protein 1 isoform X2 [Choristoneura fumiferana]
MWVMSLEDHKDVKRFNLFTETLVAGATKRLKRVDTALKVCVTNHNSMYLTARGSIYSGALPSLVDTSMCTGNICDIQCGYEHSLLLTDTGQVYSWGNGRKLQLGHGNLTNIESPTLIEALAGVTITQISAGGWHSLALSEFGDVYAWGWNDTGQLGIKEISSGESDKTNVDSCDLPTLVDIYDDNGDTVDLNVKQIACGNRHSAILLEDNTVWTAGCNKYGQTGFTLQTMRVDIFKKSYLCSSDSFIKCGPWATVVIEKL